MGIFQRIFGAKNIKPEPTKGKRYQTKEEAIAAAKAEIDRLIAENESRDTSNSGEPK